MGLLRPDVEAASPGALRGLQEAALRDGLVAHAAGSALYRDRYRSAGVDPSAVRSLDNLTRLPYIRGADLREGWQREPAGMLCDPDVRLWFATSGTTGAPKWTPYGPSELAMFQDVALRAYHMIVSREGPFRCAIFGTPAPFASDAAAYALLFSTLAAGLPVEYLITSPTQAQAALAFLAERRPTAVVGFPSLLLRVAEGIAAEAPTAARAAWRAEPSLRTFAGALATTIMRIQPRHIYRPEVGIFGGEPLAPYRRALKDAWGIRAFEIYAMTEYPCYHVECSEGNGMHLWSDWCIPELIPLEALEREETDPNAVPVAHHLFDAAPGAVGEFVFTSFGRVLPLIRYRTGDVMEVVDVSPCGCGRTHPRVRVRGRRDDLVNLGVIRFSTTDLDSRLDGLPGLAAWQLRIRRVGYKPLPVLFVVPASPGTTEAALTASVAGALEEIDILQTGIDNGLVLSPEIRVVAAIEEVRTWSGKRRRVIDETPV